MELIKGVPQRSVLESILFNLYLNDLFYLNGFTEFCNFGDDKMFHGCNNDLNNLIKRLEHDAFLAIEYFKTNNMKLNKEKCHRLVWRHNYENVWVKMGDKKERNLNFDDHVVLICKKARKKLAVLEGLSKFMSLK